MKILSWNIWVDCDFIEVKTFLESASADIVGLQEVKNDDDARDVISFMSGLGYGHFFASTEQIWDGKIWRHGPAVFSKYPIVYTEKVKLFEGNDERAAAYIQVKIENEILHVFSVHLVHTHQQTSKDQELQTRKLLERLPQERVIVMGDFNAEPSSASIQMMLLNLKDADLLEQPTWCIHPAGCHVCNKKTLDAKLDYIFTSADLKCADFKVGKSTASDHLPIEVRIDL